MEHTSEADLNFRWETGVCDRFAVMLWVMFGYLLVHGIINNRFSVTRKDNSAHQENRTGGDMNRNKTLNISSPSSFLFSITSVFITSLEILPLWKIDKLRCICQLKRMAHEMLTWDTCKFITVMEANWEVLVLWQKCMWNFKSLHHSH